jgi:hypothetical protein
MSMPTDGGEHRKGGDVGGGIGGGCGASCGEGRGGRWCWDAAENINFLTACRIIHGKLVTRSMRLQVIHLSYRARKSAVVADGSGVELAHGTRLKCKPSLHRLLTPRWREQE